MKIGFTGTRRGMSPPQRARVEQLIRGLLAQGIPAGATFHHGDCVGADEEAHQVARDLGLGVFVHPPEDSRLRAFCTGAIKVYDQLPYLTRNRNIVDFSDVLIATPFESWEHAGGTWSTVRYARKRGKPVLIVYPDGTVEPGP